MATGGATYSPTSMSPTQQGGASPQLPKLKKKKPKVAPTSIKKNPPAAKPKAKTQNAVAPYDPYAPLDPKAIEANARAQAQSTIQPQLDSLDSQGRDLSGAHATRQQELNGWYGNFQNTLDKSYNDTNSALNNLMTLNNQGGTEANAAFGAALRAGDSPVDTAANMMGGASIRPQDQDAQIMAAAEAAATNDRNFVAANAMGALQGQGERRGLAGIGLIDAGNAENRRYDAANKELTNQRTDVSNRLGDLTNSARQTIQGNEATKLGLAQSAENQRFQQQLANSELGLKADDQSFQHDLSTKNLNLDAAKYKSQTDIDWANVAINKTQAEAQLAQINSEGGTTGKEKAKLRGQQWSAGLDALSGYMTPAKGEAAPGVEDPAALQDADGNPLKLYRRSYEDALRILTGQVKMSKGDALRLLSASDFASWRSKAKKSLAIAHGTYKKPKAKPKFKDPLATTQAKANKYLKGGKKP